MSKKQQEQEIIETNDTLQTQIDASISVARSLVESWLPPPKPGDKIEDTEEDTKTKEEYSTGRPERYDKSKSDKVMPLELMVLWNTD